MLQSAPMKLTLDQRALACALLAALLSLAGALLIASPIEKATNASLPLIAPPAPASPSSLLPSAQLAAQGAGYFAQSCGDCHGDDAHGDEGPDLHNLAISNARIAAQIKNGEKGQMPSFAKKYNDQQIAALIAYLRTLR